MRVSKQKIEAAIWKERFKQLKLFAALGFVFLSILSGIYFFHLESGESYEVAAKVQSIGGSQGYDGSSGYLVCKLDNGGIVTVFVETPSLVKVGDQVVLKASEKFIKFLGNEYTFVRLGELVSE